MSNEASSSRGVSLPPPPPAIQQEGHSAAYGRFAFEPASQAQILRAHQRDTSQIRRLIELVSESLRSLAGTRWLAHRQSVVDVTIRAVYLVLTFGRGRQTLGEEYTDITPYARRWKPTRTRRIATILFLLFPSILSSLSLPTYLRQSDTSTAWGRAKNRIAGVIESPLGQSLPELHMIAFLISGRFFEFGRRLTGITYISTQPTKPPERAAASYEPLALLLALPMIFRLIPRRSSTDVPPATLASEPLLPLSPPLKPALSAEQTLLSSIPADYDTSNTYLSSDAQSLPERQCTLCLEPRGTGEGSGGTVAVTECGHIFCWGCLGGLEKPECPLCRQNIRMERLIAAYNL